jgi:chaperonin cofactor prefoldin
MTPMDSQKMFEDLSKQAEVLKKDLVDLEQQFNMKKEQFIRIQGALEALSLVNQKETEEE